MRLSVNKSKYTSRKKTLSHQIRKSYQSLIITVIILNVIFGALLLYTGSLSNAQGYTLKKLQLEKLTLETEMKNMDSKITEAKSFEKILNSPKKENMDKAEKITFFEDNSTIVKHTK